MESLCEVMEASKIGHDENMCTSVMMEEIWNGDL